MNKIWVDALQLKYVTVCSDIQEPTLPVRPYNFAVGRMSCSKPTIPSDSTSGILKENYSVGETIDFTCKSNAFEKQTITCLTDGSWSNVGFACGRKSNIFCLCRQFTTYKKLFEKLVNPYEVILTLNVIIDIHVSYQHYYRGLLRCTIVYSLYVPPLLLVANHARWTT
jgi:hypothetical protein